MKLYSAPHTKYKDSDNEWDEFIPADWDEKRVKDIFNLITDTAPENNDFELLSLYASIGVRPRKEMEQRGNKAVTTDGYWMVKKGDIVVNKLLAWMGAIGLSEYEGVTSPAYDILRKASDQVDERFYTYLFRTEKSQAIFKRHSRGIMDVRLRLYFDKFGAITVPFPSISEQKKIAHYLDTKTAQIDRQIDLLTQKAQRYEELKRSLINETVTRGLDKSVPMKDSGIDWIGEIPKHWEVTKLSKTLKKLTNGYVGPTREIMKESGVPYIQGIHIKDNSVKFTPDGYYYVDREWSKKHPKSILKEDDILVVQTGSIGQVGIVPKEFEGANCHALLILRVIDSCFLAKYLLYSLVSQCGFISLHRITTGGILLHINGSKLKGVEVVIPPLEEQLKISSYLDTKTAQIDQIIQTINTQIEKLQELRKTLINDVVTGKIKVTEN
ncbi:restriction endonuclease subunit S [Roseofilum capinflatum]|uniref:Restriction endonuclease subunit S n=1 Tax=Roseofilum capinflatum BLCC-M114 TaxID=3022440 RepID=A0ABT7B578_9CYAN|nr:restriction endonuclease subunit S [Roseofilum capinflatum]MDJ1174330.1 restriction endonuclease subunit S [Roseofilum capinflatum BLCC-M114]